MSPRKARESTQSSQTLFLALITAQAAHSIEEYANRLYDVFAPARFVSSLVTTNLAMGFAVANIALVAFGLWCYYARVRPSHPSAPLWSWFWALLEGANGTGHILLALAQGGYFPGAWTAPILLALALMLAVNLVRADSPTPA